MDLDDLTDFARQSQTTDALWAQSSQYLRHEGVIHISYHLFHAPPHKQEIDFAVLAHAVPDTFAGWYDDYNLRRFDPIPLLARASTRPQFWEDIWKFLRPTPEQSGFLHDLEEAGIGHGIAFQVHGPNLRNGYVGFGFDLDGPRPSAAKVFRLQCAAQIVHVRYCELTAEAAVRKFELSPRETEILEWMAHGKSNSVIGDILGISRHTVDTMSRRLFDKLGVHDRTTAVLRGLGSGLSLG